MYQIFDPENKFWQFIGKITDVFCMGILWFFTSIPIVTIGASTTAFYEFTINQVKNTEGSLCKSYFRSFKKHFKKATILWIIQLLGLAFFLLDMWAAWNFLISRGGVPGVFIFGFCACITIIFLSCCYYIYPTLALYDFPIKKLVTNSFVMAVGNLPVTITLIVMSVILGVLLFYMSGLFFFWFGLFVFFSSYFIFGVFMKYTEKDEEDEKAATVKSGSKNDDEKWLI